MQAEGQKKATSWIIVRVLLVLGVLEPTVFGLHLMVCLVGFSNSPLATPLTLVSSSSKVRRPHPVHLSAPGSTNDARVFFNLVQAVR